MQAWLLGFLTSLFEKYAVKVIELIWAYVLKKQAEAERQRIDEENLKKYEELIRKEGVTSEELSKAGQDLLNGRRP